MRKRATTFWMLLSACAMAASVPQTSADEYFFTRPNLPSNIVGTVMGDPPAYNIPRSEDIAWLHEAYAERVALAGGAPFGGSWTGELAEVVGEVPSFGRWPFSATNIFSRWVAATEIVDGAVTTNIIVGYNFVTNRGTGVDTATIEPVNPYSSLATYLLSNTNNLQNGFLSTNDAVYLSSARAFDSHQAVTNVVGETIMFDRWTNATTVVSMQMTNGTVSVWTNSWRVYAPTSVTINVTNVTGVGASGIPSIFTNGTVCGYGRMLPPPLAGILTTANITNHYAFLCGARRLARETTTTNDLLLIVGSSDDTGEYVASTNRLSSMPVISRKCTSGAYDSYSPDGWDYETPDYVPISWTHDSGTSGSQYFTRSISGSQRFSIRISVAAAAPMGRLTISSARVFVNVLASFSETSSAGRNGPDPVSSDYETNITARATVPAGTVVPTISRPGEISFDVTLDDSIFDSAWNACGFPSALPSSDTYFPSLRFPCPPGTHGTYADQSYGGTSSTTLDFSCEIPVGAVYVLLDFAPLTSLPEWYSEELSNE